MQSEISLTCMFLFIAKETWDAIHQTYSKVRDVAQIYELKTKIHDVKQGTISIIEYYSVIKGLWLELDHYQSFKTECNKDATIYQEFLEKERLCDFLASLNDEFDQIGVQILGKDPLSSLNETFAIVR